LKGELEMLLNNKIWVGTSAEGAVCLLPKMANRHGMISGATGTGKTVTLQVLAEGFSQLGVPVFMADVKGDLAGLSKPGERTERIVSRLEQVGVTNYTNRACPVTFWDVFGKSGHPVRATVSEMGPLLLARMLQINETQAGVLHLVFRIADEEGLLLIDLKDLRAMLAYVGERSAGLYAAIRQHLQDHHRRHPARHRGAGGSGRQSVLRRAGAQHHRLVCARRGRQRHDQHPVG
jgi:hypothetical protein